VILQTRFLAWARLVLVDVSRGDEKPGFLTKSRLGDKSDPPNPVRGPYRLSSGGRIVGVRNRVS
jgi:hypothetical protein